MAISELIKNQIGFTAAGSAILVFLALTVFCQFVDFPLTFPLLLLFVGLHIGLTGKAKGRLLLQLGLLLTLLVFTTHYLKTYTTVSPLFLPVAGVAMLTVLLYNDLELAFLMSFVGSAATALLLKADLNIMLIFFLGSLTGVYCTRAARTRGRIIAAGIYVGLVQVIGMILFQHAPELLFNKDYYVHSLRPLALSGIYSSVVVIFGLKVFEAWFGVLTNFSLLELTDFNQPLLKRMILEAPGTYHHSLVVSNLAEAAADAIGANGLLSRVGAYYHDIGKMEKPEYFVENQIIAGNKHDEIEPSISRLVILNHVREGLELARRYKLSPLLLDFIRQHHGTGLMHYFYQRALVETADEAGVKEETYRYPGPKPQTREAAIVLLADSVEAATRSVNEPNPLKIEEVVRKVINNKFIDGQLDECTLTLKEIEAIARTFTRILSAMYHGRVKYPEKKNGNDSRGRKPADEDSAPALPDSPGSKDGP